MLHDATTPLGDLSTRDLEDRIATLAAHISAAEYQFLRLVAELDRRRAWAVHGVRSAAHWLAWRCGIGLNAAREKVRVATALAGLPRISEVFAEGRLSFSKVRALTRIAAPHNEEWLLNLALSGTAITCPFPYASVGDEVWTATLELEATYVFMTVFSDENGIYRTKVNSVWNGEVTRTGSGSAICEYSYFFPGG